MADRVKSVVKGGWHPERDAAGNFGGKSDTHINQLKGWVGKGGKDTHAAAALQHESAPLSSLKDPASFAPPPRRVDSEVASPATQRPAISRPAIQSQQPLPGPYGSDTTGLNAANLPKPPTFRTASASKGETPAKPALPPRLPPRQTDGSATSSASPPPAYSAAAQQVGSTHETLNQGALHRLGKAGVSVPGLGIGAAHPPHVPARYSSSSGPNAKAASTSWADKQAMLRTASSLRDGTTKVSASDSRNAATTAKSFQQRHGDQVALGLKTANGLHQKYDHKVISSPNTVQKGPPPPPPRKTWVTSSTEAPPIPLGSKPKF